MSDVRPIINTWITALNVADLEDLDFGKIHWFTIKKIDM
jgi:hypothetical protein